LFGIAAGHEIAIAIQKTIGKAVHRSEYPRDTVHRTRLHPVSRINHSTVPDASQDRRGRAG
jgi:hypothetical protein